MAHFCSVYPFHADAGFGERGALIGANVTAGLAGFFFDPFEFYAQGHLTNPNVIVMGSVGFGKSATVKALIRRLNAVYGDGRYLAIIDPKGEYGALAADLGRPGASRGRRVGVGGRAALPQRRPVRPARPVRRDPRPTRRPGAPVPPHPP
jgi:hypothetical protein